MFIFVLIVTIIIWMLNLQFNPSLGHIWIRPDENGKKIFAWRNLIQMLIEPFRNLYLYYKDIPHVSFWNPRMWDINFYTLFIIVYIVTLFLKKI